MTLYKKWFYEQRLTGCLAAHGRAAGSAISVRVPQPISIHSKSHLGGLAASSRAAIILMVPQSLNTLLVDYWPSQSAAAQAANNLVRCELSAVGLAVLDIMIKRLGVGWCFVVLAVFHGLTFPVLLLLQCKGLAWRQARLVKSVQ